MSANVIMSTLGLLVIVFQLVNGFNALHIGNGIVETRKTECKLLCDTQEEVKEKAYGYFNETNGKCDCIHDGTTQIFELTEVEERMMGKEKETIEQENSRDQETNSGQEMNTDQNMNMNQVMNGDHETKMQDEMKRHEEMKRQEEMKRVQQKMAEQTKLIEKKHREAARERGVGRDQIIFHLENSKNCDTFCKWMYDRETTSTHQYKRGAPGSICGCIYKNEEYLFSDYAVPLWPKRQ